MISDVKEAFIKLFCDMVRQRYGGDVNSQMVGNALELLETISQNLNSLPENIVKKYFQYAEIDYKSAKLLYDNKIYPSMVFHVQQAVEKLAKAYALYLGILKKNELRSKKDIRGVNHESPMAFVLILKKKGAMDLILLISTILSLRWKNYESTRKQIEDFERLLQKRKELAKMSKAEIKSLVLKGEEIVNKLSKIDPRIVRGEVQKAKLGFGVGARRMGLTIDVATRKIFSVFGDLKAIKKVFDSLILFAKLYILAIITFPHSFYTRYPYDDIQMADYKEGLGIIDYAGELLNTIEETMNALKDSWKLDSNVYQGPIFNTLQNQK